MKTKNVAFILMFCVFAFSMCKKDKVDSTTLPGGGVGPGGNGNTGTARLVSFSPESGAIGDTINITGVNFTGNPNNIFVNFGNTQASVLKVSTTNNNNVSTTVISVEVPFMADTTTRIKVSVDGALLTSEKSFTRTSISQFSGFSPASGFIGDTITITGTFYKNRPVVNFGDARAWVIAQDSKSLRVIVPGAIRNATPAINVIDGQTMTSTTLFHLKAPVIDSITPKTAYLGQVIRINGKGLMNSVVNLDNSWTNNVIDETNTSISVNTKDAGLGTHGIAVEVAGLKTQAKDSVKLIPMIPPVITSIDRDTVVSHSDIVILGEHLLSPSPEVPATVTTVDVDGTVKKFDIRYNADNEIIATWPALSKTGNYKVTVTVLTASVVYSKDTYYLTY